MLEGLMSAASGMEAQQNQFDAISNDMANLDTPGYKSTVVGFHDLLYSDGAIGSSKVATGAGTAAQIVGRDNAQGAINVTHQPLDVAVQGEGFLQVRRFDGTTALTRNGRLEINANRQLTNQQGMLVQPPITIPSGVPVDQVTIGADGTVAAAGKRVGKLSLVTVPAPNGLLADGDSVFSATAASGTIRAAKGATVQQGALEGSNVDLGDEMAKMMDAQQQYAMGSQAIQYQAQMLQIANQIKP
jgi:flagellar basal-body rod protein FlgG